VDIMEWGIAIVLGAIVVAGGSVLALLFRRKQGSS
jgi:hypothetical protein